MKNFFVCIALFVVIFFPNSKSFGEHEEFYVVTDAPIAVDGGMIRYYLYNDNDKRTSIRYSFGGLQDNNILVTKIINDKTNDFSSKEFIKVPLKKRLGKLQIGTHKIQLMLNEYNRVIVKEIEK